MNENETKPKYIKFSDGRQGVELEVLADELASEMPKEVRGKLAPSVLWIARHYKTQNDDLRVNREKVKELEKEVERLQAQFALASSPRTIDVAKRMIADKICPVCGNEMTEYTSHFSKENRIRCSRCRLDLAGTFSNPSLTRN